MASSRAPSWSHEEILALIRVWSDQSIQDMLDGATRTADIYRRIADRLLQEGSFQRSPKQCKDKIKNLRQFYKDLKDGHNRSGFNRDNWPYYELIDSVLGDRPATRPQVVVDTTMPRSSQDEEVESPIDTSESINSLPAELRPTTEDDETQEEQEEPTIVAGQQRDANHRGVQPRAKRSKTGIEKALSSITETFVKHQLDMEERMQKAEERRQQLEMETMERMRREDREHELRLFQMLGQLIGTSGPQYYVPPPPPPAHPSAMPFTSMSPPPRPPDHTDNNM